MKEEPLKVKNKTQKGAFGICKFLLARQNRLNKRTKKAVKNDKS